MPSLCLLFAFQPLLMPLFCPTHLLLHRHASKMLNPCLSCLCGPPRPFTENTALRLCLHFYFFSGFAFRNFPCAQSLTLLCLSVPTDAATLLHSSFTYFPCKQNVEPLPDLPLRAAAGLHRECSDALGQSFIYFTYFYAFMHQTPLSKGLTPCLYVYTLHVCLPTPLMPAKTYR